MKKVVIVHCWGGDPDYCWYPKTKQELEEKGFEVSVPEMPETDFPKQSLWLTKLKDVTGKTDGSLFLIGHSLGCITILRFLEQLKDNEKIDGAVLVAGFTDDLGFPEVKNFFTAPVNFEKIKNKARYFVAINSDNDPYVDLKYAEEFKQKLGAKVIIKHNMGHFSGPIDNEESCTHLPDVAESVLGMI
ncbi:serine hydrolase family protein [Candidatus Daviesbacteria bacterium]|nr:serine hydrolase family protein [Candidatus Daviesbacteria bacterium]